MAPGHQVLRMTEVVAADASRVDSRQHDQLDTLGRGVALGEEAVVPGDGEGGQQDVDGATGELTGALEVSDVEHVDPRRPESDRPRDGDVVDDAAVDVGLTL